MVNTCSRGALAIVLPLLALGCSQDTPLPPGFAGGASGASGVSGVSGASGAAGSTPLDGLAPDACTASATPGRTPLRRLTGTEYDNTVRDLLNEASRPSSSFPPPEESLGFLNNADAFQTTELHVEAFFSTAEALAAGFRQRGGLNLPCSAEGQSCATQFIRDFGRRAFRRPLSEAEVTSYVSRFVAGSTGGTFEEGLEWVVERMLQSPHFLYRVELDGEGTAPGQVVPLSSDSIATRLAYFLWQTMPDAELFAAADAQQLATVEGVAAQAARMMASPAFEASLNSFHSQWTGWDRVFGAPKLAVTTPTWDAQIQADMIRESELFVKSIFEAQGTLRDLLTATHTFVSPALAQFYGIPYTGSASEFVRVESAPHRYGLLTQPAILAGHAHPDQSAPVKRGEMIRKHLLCTDPPPPPPNLMIVIPEVKPGLTTRERFEAHRTEPSCFGCHVLLDPLGVPLENYDELGRYRELDGGKPVDANGGLTMVASLGNVVESTAAPVNGPIELGEKLAATAEAQQCMVFNWFRYAMGHAEEQADTCMVNALLERFGGSQQNLHDLLIGIATSDGFRYRVDLPQ